MKDQNRGSRGVDGTPAGGDMHTVKKDSDSHRRVLRGVDGTPAGGTVRTVTGGKD